MRTKQGKIEKFALQMTHLVGTPSSLVIHTILFLLPFAFAPVFGLQTVLLVLTTALSLEAIYLSLFIQMTVNRHHRELSSDIDEILEDTEELTEDETTD